jgi:hypothetical protein
MFKICGFDTMDEQHIEESKSGQNTVTSNNAKTINYGGEFLQNVIFLELFYFSYKLIIQCTLINFLPTYHFM